MNKSIPARLFPLSFLALHAGLFKFKSCRTCTSTLPRPNASLKEFPSEWFIRAGILAEIHPGGHKKAPSGGIT